MPRSLNEASVRIGSITVSHGNKNVRIKADLSTRLYLPAASGLLSEVAIPADLYLDDVPAAIDFLVAEGGGLAAQSGVSKILS